jgi:hypothetical protein
MRPCSMVIAAALFTTVLSACDRANLPVGPSAQTLPE